MAVLDRVKNALKGDDDHDDDEQELKGAPVPRKTQERLKRGRTAMRKDAPLRRLCVKFWRGGAGQYFYLNDEGRLGNQSVSPFGVGPTAKPQHRIRNAYDFLHSIIEGKVSQATQRIPGYEITPSTSDPDDIAAARLAGQIATYGYDQWRLRRASIKTVTNALVQREGFAMPYFDANVGPFIQVPKTDEITGEPVLGPDGVAETEQLGMGEIKVWVGSRSEVMWEPGMDFDDSPWHAIERAMVVDEIEEMPGFLGGKVQPDATTADLPTERDASDNMARVTTYFERPCREYPNGWMLTICNDRQICKPEAFPNRDADGQVVDQPVLHRLSYTVDPEGDDRGLLEHGIDLARTINDCWCKLLEWKNRCLMPQRMARRGSNVSRADDIPGSTTLYDGSTPPTWERSVEPPQSLFQMLEQAVVHLRSILGDIDVQPQPDLAGKTINAAVEQANIRWQSFQGDLAEWHSRLMRHCLTLVALHYEEGRQVEINGQYDWASVADFTGKDLRSQVNVRVLPGSIESKGRQQVMQELEFLQTNWPNAISPEAAIAVLHGGSADQLLKSPQYDIARAARMVRLLSKGLPALEEQFAPTLAQMTVGPQVGVTPDGKPMYGNPGDPDPMTGVPVSQTVTQEVPGWLPRKQDNIPIYKQVVGDAMKTPEYDQSPPDIQQGFNMFWGGLEMREQERAMERAQLEMQMAAGQGLANAAAPQGEIAQPDKRSSEDAGQPPPSPSA